MTTPSSLDRPGQEWIQISFAVEHNLQEVTGAINALNNLANETGRLLREPINPTIAGLRIRNPFEILMYLPAALAGTYAFQRLIIFAIDIPNHLDRNRAERQARAAVMRALKRNKWTPELRAIAKQLGIMVMDFPIEGIRLQNDAIRNEVDLELEAEPLLARDDLDASRDLRAQAERIEPDDDIHFGINQ